MFVAYLVLTVTQANHTNHKETRCKTVDGNAYVPMSRYNLASSLFSNSFFLNAMFSNSVTVSFRMVEKKI